MRRRGFTIIELLVVIGIIAVLLGITMPALFMARGAAMKVVCAARLRDLVTSCTMYQIEHRAYPQPMQRITASGSGPANVYPAPQLISGDLLNQLRGYLKFPEIGPATTVAELPPFLQCPFVEMSTSDRGPFASPAPLGPTYYTGYAYLGRVPEVSVKATPPPPNAPLSLLPLLPQILPVQLNNLPLIGGLAPVLQPAIELKPGRASDGKTTKYGVLWADNVSQNDDADKPWQYTHTKRATRGGTAIRYTTPEELIGQHRAFTDGSVQWVKAKTEELNCEKAQSSNLAHASLKTLLGELWWF